MKKKTNIVESQILHYTTTQLCILLIILSIFNIWPISLLDGYIRVLILIPPLIWIFTQELKGLYTDMIISDGVIPKNHFLFKTINLIENLFFLNIGIIAIVNLININYQFIISNILLGSLLIILTLYNLFFYKVLKLKIKS